MVWWERERSVVCCRDAAPHAAPHVKRQRQGQLKHSPRDRPGGPCCCWLGCVLPCPILSLERTLTNNLGRVLGHPRYMAVTHAAALRAISTSISTLDALLWCLALIFLLEKKEQHLKHTTNKRVGNWKNHTRPRSMPHARDRRSTPPRDTRGPFLLCVRCIWCMPPAATSLCLSHAPAHAHARCSSCLSCVFPLSPFFFLKGE